MISLKLDETLIRRGGNQLSVLAMAAGAIGYVLTPSSGLVQLYLALAGLFFFLCSALKINFKSLAKQHEE